MQILEILIGPEDVLRPGVAVVLLQDKSGNRLGIGPPTTGTFFRQLLNEGDVLHEQTGLFDYLETVPEDAPRAPDNKILVRSPPVAELYPMRVTRYLVDVGDGIGPDDSIVYLEDANGKRSAISVPTSGKVLALLLNPGDILKKPELLFQYEEGHFPSAPRSTITPAPKRTTPPKAARARRKQPAVRAAKSNAQVQAKAAKTAAAAPDGLWQLTPTKRVKPYKVVLLFMSGIILPFVISFAVLAKDFQRGITEGVEGLAATVAGLIGGADEAQRYGATLSVRLQVLQQDLAVVDNGRTPTPTDLSRQDFNDWIGTD
ncbi:hypothetical protein [Pacificibacter marinus]|uniref:hypothetical protein n=1 Tax=Pacificibacter marinus TaxID=658057 RepID=UPI001C06C5AD|nr:hypothetical protein [Pacificibacter marinus]